MTEKDRFIVFLLGRNEPVADSCTELRERLATIETLEREAA